MPETSTPSPRRPHRSSKQWRTIVNRFEKSGMKVNDFCHQEKLARPTFSKWRRRFHQESDLPGFIELQPTITAPPTSESWSVQLDLPGGGHLNIRFGL